jgi:N-methylhydantoinase B
MSNFDPVLVEVINNELGAITEEIAVVIWRAGRSPMVKTGDFATGVLDATGRVIGQGFAAPFQLAIFEELLAHVLARYGSDFAPGDVVITNDPYAGMGHMPDFGVVVPVVVDGRVNAFCVSYSHHGDVGGRFPGSSSSEGGSSYEEGLRVPIAKLYDAGRRNDVLLDLIRANVRMPDEWLGDMEAKIAGCQRGAEQTAQLIRKHGWERYSAACNHVIEHAERSMRAAIARVPAGAYTATTVIPDAGTDGGGIMLKLTLTVQGEEILADFTGSTPQVNSALNMPLTMTKAAVSGALKSVIGSDLPTNHGFFRPIRVHAPAGSVVNPTFPAAVAGRAPVFFRTFDLVNAALAQALPGRVAVTGEGGDLMHFSGHRGTGEEFAFLDVFFGGWGARPTKDGIDGVAPVYMGSYGCVSAELVEAQNPVVFEGFGFVPDSEGAGVNRGSVAIYRQWRFLAPGHAMVRSVRLGPAPGLEGGAPGLPSRTTLVRGGEEKELTGKTHIHILIEPGDRIYHATSGAGGFGDPGQRDPELVRADWRAGLVTPDGARARYGVVLLGSGELDVAATEALRSAGPVAVRKTKTHKSKVATL